MKSKFRNILNIVYITVFFIFLLLFSIYVLLIKQQRDISEIENRYLAKSDEILSEDFIENKLQEKVDLVLSDQFLFRYEIVKLKRKLDYFLDLALFPIDNSIYKLTAISEDNKIMQLGTTSFMVGTPMLYEERIQTRVQRRIEQYNKLALLLPQTEIVVYHPTQAHETDLFDYFNDIDSYGRTVEKFFEELEVPYASLKIESVETIMSWFYSSDHHWNNRGSYQGYKDILKLLDSDVSPLEPLKEKCGLKFEGTYSSRTGYVLGPSDFCVYEYNFKPYQVFVDDKEIKNIHDTNLFFDGYDKKLPNQYYYNDAYDRYESIGSLVKYESGINDQKVLVVGDSYMPPLLPLLVQHYGTVYGLYPVEYNANHEFFDYVKFINENQIDRVVFMTTIENYFFDDQYGERYKMFDIFKGDQ